VERSAYGNLGCAGSSPEIPARPRSVHVFSRLSVSTVGSYFGYSILSSEEYLRPVFELRAGVSKRSLAEGFRFLVLCLTTTPRTVRTSLRR